MPMRSEDLTGTTGREGARAPGRRTRWERVREPSFAWTRSDALLAIGTAANDLIGFSLGATEDGRPLTVSAVVLVVLGGACVLARRARPVTVLCAVLALGVALNLTTPQGPHFSAAFAVALYTVTRLRGPAVTAAAALATVPLTLISGGHGEVSALTSVLSNTVAVLLVVGTGLLVRRWQQEAEARRTLLADRAVAEERRRIARELHDIVAHHITTMQLMAGGARANLAHDPEAAREALVTLEGSGRMALGEMRQLLDVLRAGEEPEQVPPEPQPGAGDLGRIITESRLAGTPTEFTVHGTARPLPPTVGLTVFRIVQEALTNARKHAGGARAHVRLTYRPEGVDVEVRDDGAGARPGSARPAAGSGYGLIGMRERVALQGGTLEAGACDGGGFRVAAVLPAGAVPGGRGGERRG
ncbi:sensor histidine kinase [Streptomyces goshikiensis]|uniref:sensor histidine kinase n=1 Tax=Streptomyces goshikiensis TaxID=1942 RepID=UPI0036791899